MNRFSQRNTSTVLFVCIIFSFVLCSLSQITIQQFEDNWYSLDQFYGKLYQKNTMLKQCNPCDYLLKVYQQQIVLTLITPTNSGVNSFRLAILSSTQQDGLAFDEKSYNLSKNKDQKVAQSLTRFVTDRLIWNYQFTLPNQGIIIKGQYQNNHYITPILSLTFALLSLVLLPLRSNFLKKLTNLIYKRTSLISMIIISQNLHFLLIYYAATTIKYLLWEESFLLKFVWYGVFMSTLSILIVHTILFYSTIQKHFNESFSKKQLTSKVKNILLMLIFLITIIVFDIVCLFFQKQIFFYYYFTLGFIFQVGYSIKKKIYPYMPVTIYSFLINFTLLVFANILPIFKFQQTTRFEIVIFCSYCLILFLIGNFSLSHFIGLQNLVQFEQTNQQIGKEISEQNGKRNSQMQIVQRQM